MAIPYASGSWAPVIGGDGGETGQSYSTQNGRWVRIGNLVFIRGFIVFTNKGTITGNIVLKTLPLTPLSTGPHTAGSIANFVFNSSVSTWVGLQINPGSAQAYLIKASGGAGNSVLQVSDVLNNSQLIFSAVYETSP